MQGFTPGTGGLKDLDAPFQHGAQMNGCTFLFKGRESEVFIESGFENWPVFFTDQIRKLRIQILCIPLMPSGSNQRMIQNIVSVFVSQDWMNQDDGDQSLKFHGADNQIRPKMRVAQGTQAFHTGNLYPWQKLSDLSGNHIGGRNPADTDYQNPENFFFFVPTRFAGVVNLICFSDGWLSHVCF